MYNCIDIILSFPRKSSITYFSVIAITLKSMIISFGNGYTLYFMIRYTCFLNFKNILSNFNIEL